MFSTCSGAVAAVLMLASANAQGTCSHPPPARNFTNVKYQGNWKEIAKIQTWGGAVFEQSCVCTELNIEPKADGNYRADNICRDKTPQGKVTNASGVLENENPPGRWEEVSLAASRVD